MGPSVYVKVVGFNDVERHALNTLFRLSSDGVISYGLWTLEAPVAPSLALIDLDAYEATMVLASPGLNPDLKIICVGHGAPVQAWRTFQRPLNWPDVVQAMDSLFESRKRPNAGVDFGASGGLVDGATGSKLSLLVDPVRQNRMYLRARLALVGHTAVDETASGVQALEWAQKRPYDLVIVGRNLPDTDGWALIRQLVALEPAIGSVLVSTSDKSWHTREYAQACGCSGLLEQPYDPLQVAQVLKAL